MTRGAERRSRSARGRDGDVRPLQVGTARRIGKALTNNPPYPVGGRAIVAYTLTPARAYIRRGAKDAQGTKRPQWLAPRR